MHEQCTNSSLKWIVQSNGLYYPRSGSYSPKSGSPDHFQKQCRYPIWISWQSNSSQPAHQCLLVDKSMGAVAPVANASTTLVQFFLTSSSSQPPPTREQKTLLFFSSTTFVFIWFPCFSVFPLCYTC